MHFEDKHHVFIVSGGRTGTKYFATVLSQLIEDSFSVHEPDVFLGFNDPHLWTKLRDFGVYNLMIGKLFRSTGIRNLSENYLGGRIDLEKMKKKIISHRQRYYSRIKENLIIESYYGWYGCLDAIPELYRHHNILGVLRNPRTWVVSHMNWQVWYGERDRLSKFGPGRISPKVVKDTPYIDKWDSFTRFQKICWGYKTVYEEIYKQSQRQEKMKLIRFEDIFHKETGHQHIREAMEYICHFDDRDFKYDFDTEIIDKRIHKNISYKFPSYDDWTKEQKEQYHEICGEIESKLQYN